MVRVRPVSIDIQDYAKHSPLVINISNRYSFIQNRDEVRFEYAYSWQLFIQVGTQTLLPVVP